ncbi:MAG TPA: hypothetical protein VF746_04035 [Longimicrobium sp.]|jgi:hypothetical protein
MFPSFRHTAGPRFWRDLRDWTQVSAIAFAAFFGIYTFWYTDIIGPARLPAALVVVPRLEEIGRFGDTAVVRATFQIANQSQSNVWVPAMWYRVTGMRFAPQDASSPWVRYSAAGREEHRARYSRLERQALVASGRLFEHRTNRFQPGGQSQLEEVFLVPICEYDVVRLQVDYAQFRNVEGLQEIGWETKGEETIAPTFTVSNWRGKPERLKGERYKEWKKAHGAAFNYTLASLPLRSAVRAPTAPPVNCGAAPERAAQP